MSSTYTPGCGCLQFILRSQVQGSNDSDDSDSGLTADRDCRRCGRSGTTEDSASDTPGAHRCHPGTYPPAADREAGPGIRIADRAATHRLFVGGGDELARV